MTSFCFEGNTFYVNVTCKTHQATVSGKCLFCLYQHGEESLIKVIY